MKAKARNHKFRLHVVPLARCQNCRSEVTEICSLCVVSICASCHVYKPLKTLRLIQIVLDDLKQEHEASDRVATDLIEGGKKWYATGYAHAVRDMIRRIEWIVESDAAKKAKKTIVLLLLFGASNLLSSCSAKVDVNATTPSSNSNTSTSSNSDNSNSTGVSVKPLSNSPASPTVPTPVVPNFHRMYVLSASTRTIYQLPVNGMTIDNPSQIVNTPTTPAVIAVDPNAQYLFVIGGPIGVYRIDVNTGDLSLVSTIAFSGLANQFKKIYFNPSTPNELIFNGVSNGSNYFIKYSDQPAQSVSMTPELGNQYYIQAQFNTGATATSSICVSGQYNYKLYDSTHVIAVDLFATNSVGAPFSVANNLVSVACF